jgi:hypothetical protein
LSERVLNAFLMPSLSTAVGTGYGTHTRNAWHILAQRPTTGKPVLTRCFVLTFISHNARNGSRLTVIVCD